MPVHKAAALTWAKSRSTSCFSRMRGPPDASRSFLGLHGRDVGPCLSGRHRPALARPRGRRAIADLQLAADCDPVTFPDLFRTTVFHELAHVLECWRGELPAIPSPDTLSRKSRLFQFAVEECSGALATAPVLTPWFLHELPFIRSCCHLAYRLRKLGAPRDSGGARGRLALRVVARRILPAERPDHEPRRMRRLPIHRILTLPATKAERLFAQDVAAWRERQEATA